MLLYFPASFALCLLFSSFFARRRRFSSSASLDSADDLDDFDDLEDFFAFLSSRRAAFAALFSARASLRCLFASFRARFSSLVSFRGFSLSDLLESFWLLESVSDESALESLILSLSIVPSRNPPRTKVE